MPAASVRTRRTPGEGLQASRHLQRGASFWPVMGESHDPARSVVSGPQAPVVEWQTRWL